jgi:hypothetical protein
MFLDRLFFLLFFFFSLPFSSFEIIVLTIVRITCSQFVQGCHRCLFRHGKILFQRFHYCLTMLNTTSIMLNDHRWWWQWIWSNTDRSTRINSNNSMWMSIVDKHRLNSNCFLHVKKKKKDKNSFERIVFNDVSLYLLKPHQCCLDISHMIIYIWNRTKSCNALMKMNL